YDSVKPPTRDLALNRDAKFVPKGAWGIEHGAGEKRRGEGAKRRRGEEKAKDRRHDGEILTFGLIPDRSLCGETGAEGRRETTRRRGERETGGEKERHFVSCPWSVVRCRKGGEHGEGH
ncbi:MAG: hypothetical protein KJP05_01770, partial [Deltaproteobacteria bacterium]|nr:hypothetical protein [Deltaproteobacteria bacterium]